MTGPEDDGAPGGRLLFSRETRMDNVRLRDAIEQALRELQQQIREHLPDYLAQRPGSMLVANWEAAASDGQQWRIVLALSRVPRSEGAD